MTNKTQECFDHLMGTLQQFYVSLTPRERLAFQAGLRASHIEEALAHGEIDRARSHFTGLVNLINRL